jgi:Periplasmic binding protein/Cytochrome c
MRILVLLRRSLGGLVLGWGLAAPLLAQPVAPNQARLLEIGQRIYTQGVLADGRPLQGLRFGNTLGQGAEVACVACHRPSGLGQVEGGVTVPPIAGNFLYAKPGDKYLVNMDPHTSKFFNQAHAPYTEATLDHALLKGVNNQGQTMSAAMPRYTLGDTDRQALNLYLKQLSAQWSPGVDNGSIRFASVITPEVDPVRRQAVKDMLQLIVRQKNGSTHPAQERRTRHHMTTAAELILGTERKWELDIWELQGAPETWAAQLDERYRSQPVFALLSGVSQGTWQPVHDFCERTQVPCWFPSVELPVQSMSPYAFYFSGGVVLEAQALAQHLLAQQPRPKRVLQIYQDDAVGRAASLALRQALEGSSIQVQNSALNAALATAPALRTALGAPSADTVLMLWLRPDEVAGLESLQPVGAAHYFSGLLGKGEHAPLPAAWRTNGHLIYPYALPENRATQLIYFHAWRNLRNIPLVDEALQSEVFFALNFMTDTVSDMLENFYRDYLLERAESMLSRRESGKAEQEVRDRVALGSPGELEKKHGPHKLHESTRVPLQASVRDKQGQGTTLYPQLSLGPSQRFASKGAYIVGFSNPVGEALRQESDWIVP